MGEQDALTIGEISRTLVRLDKGQEAILTRIDLMRGEFVHRTEWERQNESVKDDLADAKTSIASLEKDTQASITNLKRGLVAVVAFVITAALGIVGAYIQSGRL